MLITAGSCCHCEHIVVVLHANTRDMRSICYRNHGKVIKLPQICDRVRSPSIFSPKKWRCISLFLALWAYLNMYNIIRSNRSHGPPSIYKPRRLHMHIMRIHILLTSGEYIDGLLTWWFCSSQNANRMSANSTQNMSTEAYARNMNEEAWSNWNRNFSQTKWRANCGVFCSVINAHINLMQTGGARRIRAYLTQMLESFLFGDCIHLAAAYGTSSYV